MRIFQLVGCLRGRHLRSRRLAWNDGSVYRSWCVGCGTALIREFGEWRVDPDPVPPPAGHPKSMH